MEGLRKQIGNPAVNQNDLVHVVENSLSMLNKINTLASQNRHAMNNLVIDLGKLNNNLHKIRSLVLTLQLLNVFSRNVISGVNNITLSIAQTLENLNIEINQFASNLDKTMQGQLSTSLIRPMELRSILNDISHTLRRQKIMWYYKMLPVTVIPDNNKIHIITVIPLIPLELLFTLYRVVVIPIPILGKNRNSEVIIKGTHFVVSDRGNNFVILDEDELSKCTNSDMSYCPLHRAEMNLARMASCLGSLFLSDETGIKINCPVRVTDNIQFPIIRHLTKGEWIITTRDALVIHSRCDPENELQAPIIVSPPVQIITLKSRCTGYSDQATLPPYFYKSSNNDQATNYRRFNIGLTMDHIYELKQSNYTFDFRLTNPEPLSSVVLPETEELDMSHIIEEINRIKSNRVIVWKNDKLYTILGSVGGLLLILIIIGSCIIVIKYKLRGNTQSKCIKMKYYKGNSDRDIDPGRVVACVDIDGPNEAEPALLGGSGN